MASDLFSYFPVSGKDQYVKIPSWLALSKSIKDWLAMLPLETSQAIKRWAFNDINIEQDLQKIPFTNFLTGYFGWTAAEAESGIDWEDLHYTIHAIIFDITERKISPEDLGVYVSEKGAAAFTFLFGKSATQTTSLSILPLENKTDCSAEILGI